MTLTGLQPEHGRYWRGWRLYLADKATWPEIQDMSLDDVDLQNLLLDAVDEAHTTANPVSSDTEDV